MIFLYKLRKRRFDLYVLYIYHSCQSEHTARHIQSKVTKSLSFPGRGFSGVFLLCVVRLEIFSHRCTFEKRKECVECLGAGTGLMLCTEWRKICCSIYLCDYVHEMCYVMLICLAGPQESVSRAEFRRLF